MIKHLFRKAPVAIITLVLFAIAGCYFLFTFDYSKIKENPGVESTQAEVPATREPVQYRPGVVEVCTEVLDNKGTVNMRSGPTPDSKILLVLKEGTQLARTWEGNGWSSVYTLYHEQGYVYTKYLCEVE